MFCKILIDKTLHISQKTSKTLQNAPKRNETLPNYSLAFDFRASDVTMETMQKMSKWSSNI